MRRARLALVVLFLAALVCLPACKGQDLARKPAELPDAPPAAAPLIEAAEKPLVAATAKAQALVRAMPAELKPQAEALLDDLVSARIELAAAKASATAQDRYVAQLRKAMSERDKQIDGLQKRVEDLEGDHGFSAATWFMLIGGAILAGAIAVAIWVNIKAGLLAGTAGGALLGIGLILEYLSRNQWILWFGAALVVGVAVYLVWKYGGAERLKNVVDVLVRVGEKVGLPAQKDLKGEVAKTSADAGVADVVKAETTASKERQGLPLNALGTPPADASVFTTAIPAAPLKP